MEKLIKDSETFQKERPLTITNEQRNEVLKEVANDIIQWQLSKSSLEQIIADLDEVYSGSESGFEMAKELEDGYHTFGHYEVNSQLVELLESIDSLVDDFKRKNIQEWVKAHNIKPKFKIGDGFVLKNSPSYGFNIGEKVFITMLNSENAYYCINKVENRNGGRVIVFEKLEQCV